MTPRDEAHAGQYLKWYERMRYTPTEKSATSLIFIQPDAEQFADVSFWQAGMDWDEYRKHARAVILRIGQNVWKDVEFEHNYAEAKRRGLLVGGYFFFDGRATPAQQAAVITDAMTGKSFELELFADWEHNYGGHYEGLPNVVSLMQKVELAGVKCKAVGMYTGYYYFFENSNASANAAQYTYLKQRPLWLAWFASASAVRVPAPWTDWTHWQFGTPAVQWGQPSAELDINKHNGTAAQFTARYGETEIPPNGEPMATRYESTAIVDGTRLRPFHNTNNTYLGNYPSGTKFHGDELWTAQADIYTMVGTVRVLLNSMGDQWLRVTDVNGMPTGREAWVAVTHKGAVITVLNDNGPAAELPNEVWIGTTQANVALYRKVA